jgi:NaMN:DMB phosphoribosyltransferase
MAAVLAILSRINGKYLENVAVATTPWIINDSTSDIIGLITEISMNTPLIYVDVSFRDSKYEGLRKYEEGYVKEGVGAGAALVIRAYSGYSREEIIDSIEKEYRRITGND